MGKKSRAKAKPDVKGKSGSNNLWLILGGAAIMIAIVWITLRSSSTDPASSTASTGTSIADKFEGNKGHATLISTLDPAQFTGKARAAYQAAKEIPEVLVELPCFCGCMDSKELGHKNNLYCFADTHGNICDLCQTIALEAKEMHRKGLPIETIRNNIKKTYGSAKM
jgi:uncharacterized protein with PCYCGC motif